MPRLRRVLGKALVDSFCPFGRPLCQDRPRKGRPPRPPVELCRLAEHCPYGVLFAASGSPRPPFALHVPEADEERAEIELTLYGAAWRLYPWATSALEGALATGLGKERVPWVVERVERVGPTGRRQLLADGKVAALPAALEPDRVGISLDEEGKVSPAGTPIRVDLESPARLLSGGRLVGGRSAIPFSLLVARILDRFAGLFGREASPLLAPEVRGEVEHRAESVPLLVDDTEWREVSDYSARSGAELLLGGKVGRLVYGAEAAPFLPLLHAGEVLHVGKNPTSGCGRIRVEPLAPL